jgi:hypothetical protein
VRQHLSGIRQHTQRPLGAREVHGLRDDVARGGVLAEVGEIDACLDERHQISLCAHAHAGDRSAKQRLGLADPPGKYQNLPERGSDTLLEVGADLLGELERLEADRQGITHGAAVQADDAGASQHHCSPLGIAGGDAPSLLEQQLGCRGRCSGCVQEQRVQYLDVGAHEKLVARG